MAICPNRSKFKCKNLLTELLSSTKWSVKITSTSGGLSTPNASSTFRKISSRFFNVLPNGNLPRGGALFMSLSLLEVEVEVGVSVVT